MKAVIVEDETLSAQELKKILERIGGIQVLAQLDSIDDTVEWFTTHPDPDILFLDIHLADGSAFEIFQKADVKCPIVFTTAYDEYALSAFKVNSVSYLLKPIREEDVRQSLQKLKSLQRQDHTFDVKALAKMLRKQTGFKTHFLVSAKGDKLIPLNVSDIAFIDIENGVVKAHTFDGKIFFMDQILDELMERLDPRTFYRANRQFIIARNAVKDIDHWFQSRLSVNLTVPVSEKILISRAKVQEFKNWFTEPHL
jgi:two-component system response regulator LytT